MLADDLGVNPFLAVPLAGLSPPSRLPTATVVFRFRGGYFAVGTWAVAEVYRLLVANTDTLGRGTGRTLKAVFPLARETRELGTYALAVGIGVVALPSCMCTSAPAMASGSWPFATASRRRRAWAWTCSAPSSTST